jgi:hypothetical protein
MAANNPEGKTLALLAYASSLFLYLHLFIFIAVLGTFILLNMGTGRRFATFHHRQMVGIAVIAILINSLANLVASGWLALLMITGIVLIAMLGMLSAIKNQMQPLPYLGEYFQNWFNFIK